MCVNTLLISSFQSLFPVFIFDITSSRSSKSTYMIIVPGYSRTSGHFGVVTTIKKNLKGST